MTIEIMPDSAATSQDRVHAISCKLRRVEPVTAANASRCQVRALANNQRQPERLVYFVRAIADNKVVDPELAVARLLKTVILESE